VPAVQNAVQAQEGLGQIAAVIYPWVLSLSSIGALAMATIQTLKDLFPLRRFFQKRWIMRWLVVRAKFAPALSVGRPPDPKKAESDLVRLATSQDSKAFYDLPIEQLCGQANAALQVALDDPQDHEDLIWCFGFLCDADDLNTLLRRPARETLAKTQREMSTQEGQSVDAFSRARTRVAHQVQRSIDGLQISAGFRWKWCLQFASIVICFIFTLIGLNYYSAKMGISFNITNTLLMGILSGFLAPVARDLIAAVQQLRK
jgi:hypothetical protein